MPRRSLIFILFLILCSDLSFAQETINKNNATKSLIKVYDKGEKLLRSGKTEAAIKCFEKAIRKEPQFIDPYLRLGGIAYEKGDFESAISYFKLAMSLDAEYDIRMAQALALSLEQHDKLDEAITYFEIYRNSIEGEEKAKISQRIIQLQFIIEAKANPVPFEPEKLPESINTPQYSEYLPSLVASGQVMFFTRVTNGQEDLYYSYKDEEGSWVKAEMLPNINTYENEGAHCISADGKTIVFTFCSDGRSGLPKGCNIYISYLKNNQWTKPEFMSINSNSWDSQPNLSADGRTLIFSSRRNGGLGGSDLWISRKESNGSWSSPQNLNEPVNSEGNEGSPFQHGATLFFNSDKHLGMGSSDLFRSTHEKGTGWSVPQNLGYPINTEDHEGALIVAMDGKTAYYARGEGGDTNNRSQTDIYSFDLPEKLRTEPISFVEIWVTDSENHVPVQAKIEIQASVLQNNLRDSFFTDSDGYVLIPLPVGRNYSFIINQERYYLYSDRIELAEVRTVSNAYKRKVELTPIVDIEDVSEPVVLKNVLFETGSFTLLEESFFELEQLLSLLEANPEIKIEIRGHTDDVGNDDDNMKLSQNRARSVFDYLVMKGISQDRIQYKGFGEQVPVDTNETEEGRSRNRRTEFVIIK